MAELNDKLITYGNLSTFYDKLQEQGLGGNAIEDASVLPDACENKSKLIRLESDDKVYMSELQSRTTSTTNRLPDAQQIDKAYIWVDVNNQCYYVGACSVIFADGEVNGYGWLYFFDEHEWYLIFTEVDAEHIQANSVCYGDFNYEDGDRIDFVNRTITTAGYKDEYKSTLSERHILPITAIYNAPEANQVGNATLMEMENGEHGVYLGTTITFYDTDGETELQGYKWEDIDDNTYAFATSKPASEIYLYTDENNGNVYTDTTIWYIDADNTAIPQDSVAFKYLYIPQLNAPDSEQVGHATIEDGDGFYYTYTGEQTIISVSGTDTTVYAWVNANYGTIYSTQPAINIYNTNKDSNDVHFYEGNTVTEITFDNDGLSEIITVKYQRTEVTEVWDWKNIHSCIESVETLPNGDDNKESILRLNSDKNVYITKSIISNVPDSEQVDNAYVAANNLPITNNDKAYYKGETTIHCTNGDLTVYVWQKGNDISDIDNIYFTSYSAESIISDETFIYYYGGNWSITNLVYNGTDWNCDMTVTEVESIFANDSHDLFTESDMLYHELYLVKSSHYEWKRVVTEDELTSLEARIYALEHPNA